MRIIMQDKEITFDKLPKLKLILAMRKIKE